MEKFTRMLGKAMAKLGFIQKSEGAPAEKLEKVEEVKLEEKKEEKEDLAKSELKARDEKIESLQKTIEGLTKTVEEIAARPMGRKAVTGLQPIRKPEEDGMGQTISKSQVIDRLLDLQKSGDKRVTPVLVTKFEQSGDMNLVKDLVK